MLPLLLATALGAAPRAVTVPAASPGEPPGVLRVQDSVARTDGALLHAGDPIHASWAAAARAATAPVLYPADAVALDLTDATHAFIARSLADPQHNDTVLAVLRSANQRGASDLVEFLSVAASLGGVPLDALDLSPEVQEHASYDAASFRAKNRVLGGLALQPTAQRALLRDHWLADLPLELAVVVESITSERTDLAQRLKQRRSIDSLLYDRMGIWTVPPKSVEQVSSGGLVGEVRAALAMLDAGSMRTRALEGVVREGLVTPPVTLEPTAFWDACAAVGRHDVVELVDVTARCGAAVSRVSLDQGRTPAIPASWVDPPLPDLAPRAVPLTWRHGQDYEGLALIGVRTLEVAVRYVGAPAVEREGQPVQVALGDTRRTLLVPVWVPFRRAEVPSVDDLAVLAGLEDDPEARKRLSPAEPAASWGCSHGCTASPSLRILLGVVRRR